MDADTSADNNESLEPRVEQTDAGWVVVADVDGDRKQFGDAHPDKDTAEHHAKHYFAGSDRWTGAAKEVAPDPEKYPGDGKPGV